MQRERERETHRERERERESERECISTVFCLNTIKHVPNIHWDFYSLFPNGVSPYFTIAVDTRRHFNVVRHRTPSCVYRDSKTGERE